MVTVRHDQETVDVILKMWADDCTGSQIARVLNMTRNAVMGKLARLRAQGLIKYRDPGQCKNASKEERAMRRTHVPPGMKTKKDKPLPPLPPMIDGARPLRLMELTPDSCRFIINDSNKASDFMFCGRPKKGKSYCADHHALCYTAATPRRERGKVFRLNPRYSEVK